MCEVLGEFYFLHKVNRYPMLTQDSGHNPPIIAKDGPDVQVLNSMIDANGLYNVYLVCFSCSTWTGAAIHVDSQRAAVDLGCRSKCKVG